MKSMPTKLIKRKSISQTPKSRSQFSSSILNEHHKKMLNKKLKSKIESYLLTPRPYEDIINLRRKILSKILKYDNLTETCNIITPKAVLIIVREISQDLFKDKEIVNVLLDKFTTDESEIKYPGAFVPPTKIIINCETITPFNISNADFYGIKN